MTASKGGLRHVRVGPNIDAAPCGARPPELFVMARRHITCPTCIAMRANGPAGEAQLRKLRKAAAAMKLERRSALSQKGIDGGTI